jgi:hypothetical protein
MLNVVSSPVKTTSSAIVSPLTINSFPEWKNDKFTSSVDIWEDSASFTSNGQTATSSKSPTSSAQQRQQSWEDDFSTNSSLATDHTTQEDFREKHKVNIQGTSTVVGKAADNHTDEPTLGNQLKSQVSHVAQINKKNSKEEEDGNTPALANASPLLEESIHGFSDMEDPFPEKKQVDHHHHHLGSSLGDFGLDDDDEDSFQADDLLHMQTTSFAEPVTVNHQSSSSSSPRKFAMIHRMHQSTGTLSTPKLFSAPNFHASANLFYSQDSTDVTEGSEALEIFWDTGTSNHDTTTTTVSRPTSSPSQTKLKSKKKKKKSSTPLSAEEFERISKARLAKLHEKKKYSKTKPISADDFERVSKAKVQTLRAKKKVVAHEAAKKGKEGRKGKHQDNSEESCTHKSEGKKSVKEVVRKAKLQDSESSSATTDPNNDKEVVKKSRKPKQHDSSESSSMDSGEKKSATHKKHRRTRRRRASMDTIQPDNPLSAMVLDHFKKMQHK